MRVTERTGEARAWALAGPLAIVLTSGAMLNWGWGRWPDVVLDFGRELYVPWQLTTGRVLYTDIAYFNGPLSPYFNALCFRLLGTSLRTLVVVNLALTAALVLVLYDLLSRIGGRASATVGILVFVVVFAFGQLAGAGNYNFVCPYSHELTHGVGLALAALWFLARLRPERPTPSVVACGVCLGLVLLTKPEVFIAAAAGLVPGLLLTLGTDAHLRARRLRLLAIFAASALVPPLTAVGLLARVMPLARAIEGTASAWPLVLRGDVAALYFYRVGMGIDNPVRNASRMLHWLGVYAVVTLTIAGLGLAGRSAWSRRLTRAVVVLGVAWACVRAYGATPVEWFSGTFEHAWFHVGKPLPVVMAVLALGALARLIVGAETGAVARVRILQLATSALGLGLLAKIILAARVYHYGFALAMPAALVCVAVAVDWVPAWVARRGGDAATCRAAAVGILLAAVIVDLRVVQYFFAAKTVWVGSGADSFLADRRGPIVNQALQAITAETPPDATLTAIPEGVMLNYLTRRVDPVPYIEFIAPAVAMFGEERMLAALQTAAPDYILLVHHDPGEYGIFGREYGREIFRWLTDHYQPIALFGAPPLLEQHFGIALARRIEADRPRDP